MPEFKQTTSIVLMIRPKRFHSNAQTAASNAFQGFDSAPAEDVVQPRALAEFENLVQTLTNCGVDVRVFDDTFSPHTPDAVFPNNWFSTHQDGSVVLYPMAAENRRLERRLDVLQDLQLESEFKVTRLLDLSYNELSDRFLEGTGSLVLDRVNKIAYACKSPRTDLAVSREWAEELGYEVLYFSATDEQGNAVYHTNVMMCIGDGFAVICGTSVNEDEDRARILDRLKDTGHEIVDISFQQMQSFAGNMLQVENNAGKKILAMSGRAYKTLESKQIELLEKFSELVYSDIDTIENCSGGSVRCMMAEIFLPKN